MACLRLSNGGTSLGLDGDGKRGNRTESDLLYFTGPHDDSQCRTRGLGYSWVNQISTASDLGRCLGCLFLRNLDLSDSYILKLGRDLGGSMEFGHDPANSGCQGPFFSSSFLLISPIPPTPTPFQKKKRLCSTPAELLTPPAFPPLPPPTATILNSFLRPSRLSCHFGHLQSHHFSDLCALASSISYSPLSTKVWLPSSP